MGDGNIKKINLKALSKQQLESFIKEYGLPSFRSKQVLHWIYEKYVQSIEDITELSKDLRERLSENAYISNLELLDRQVSKDGTEKFLFGLEDGETIESVLIPDEDRLTLCISSQVGCAMACRFCLTGQLGLRRNLKSHEIIDQIISVSRLKERAITNIVLMGMGEPLSNFDNVVEALWRTTDLMKISQRRITLSTSGIVPKILELPLKAPLINLAISLNATTDEVRDYIMPINKTYPIKELLNACRKFPLPQRKRITFEYVLLKNINDSPDDAKRLINLLTGIPSKINLIPFNPYEGSEFQRPDDMQVLNFQGVLIKGHITAIIRKSKGQDIMAACGQLRARYMA
ncbi:putative dual-specificity RNA methyltransferase RlmN [Dissulfurispira thermophila]|uniref:Probable dual-specificity RNA methyltransferase RlmN n=1 Tax=Dissulfurispira thermophila TaxID=2715679 RepID=A0A7G1H5I5_9BACT|nr:23S rRNA (adenine(2503)-C(2))-methyltransferase RlmN [Dissulfurispira thermophila]BCB97362.1 putative dual-specificity RNA methyltransferase RlmN [Dissulfurispira thermophila]